MTTFRMTVNGMGMATARVRKMQAHDCDKGQNGHYEGGRINIGSLGGWDVTCFTRALYV